MTKKENLQKLCENLNRLVTILRLDPKCQWVAAFENNLAQCQNLLSEGFDESDLTALSSSVRSVFQGMGSFNDYAPGKYNPETGRFVIIPGTEEFENKSAEVFKLADKLRER